MKLHGFITSNRLAACALVMEACNVNYDVNWVTFEEMKSDQFKKLNPLGKIPVLETPEGPLYETMAIIRHIARISKKNGGASDHEQAQVDQWLSWLNAEVASTLIHFLYQTYGYDLPNMSYKPDDIKRGKDAFLNQMTVLNTHLAGKKSVVGSELTIADYAIVALSYQALAFCFGEKERSAIKEVVQLVETVGQTEAFKKYFGKVRFCAQALKVPAAPKKAAPEAKPKKEEKPKAEKKKEESDEEKAPKVVEPEFPPTELKLDAFKTLFINEPDKNAAMENFWSQFKEGEWSLYHLSYIKYPGECEVVYRTNNLLKMFFGNLESIRKYIFGTHAILGDEPKLEIEGVWLIRGAALFPQITDLDAYECYKWEKLDSSKPETRELVKDFWTNRQEDEEKIQGKVIRTFKWVK